MSTRYHWEVRIGELSERSGVSTKTIRYYEDIGILPKPPRSSSGYRDYDGDAAVRLSFIRAAQSVGLTLGEIREILAVRDRGQRPCGHVARLIEQHTTDVAERIAALQRMQRDLERIALRARRTSAGTDDAAFCHIIEG